MLIDNESTCQQTIESEIKDPHHMFLFGYIDAASAAMHFTKYTGTYTGLNLPNTLDNQIFEKKTTITNNSTKNCTLPIQNGTLKMKNLKRPSTVKP